MYRSFGLVECLKFSKSYLLKAKKILGIYIAYQIAIILCQQVLGEGNQTQFKTKPSLVNQLQNVNPLFHIN
jgi:hypothetical protein